MQTLLYKSLYALHKHGKVDETVLSQDQKELLSLYRDLQLDVNWSCTYVDFTLNDILHRENGPARITHDGVYTWWYNGMIHRPKKPAIIWPNGSMVWYFNGKLHRDDGPAYVSKTCQEWFVDGKRHRDDGPAVVKSSGRKEWWVNGNYHRLNGPAIIDRNGGKVWFINGKEIYLKDR